MHLRYQIDRFSVSNFRSIYRCEVQLAPLTIFVGPNSSGKSNFVGAISFLAKALRDPLDKVIASQGGIYSLFSHPVSFPSVLTFDVEISGPSGAKGWFSLEVEASDATRFLIKRETCRVIEGDESEHYYSVEHGKVLGSSVIFPALSQDRIYLTNASGLPEFRIIYDFLSGISVTQPATPDVYQAIEFLNGLNRVFAGSTGVSGFLGRFKSLRDKHRESFELVQDYLRSISPTFQKISFRGEGAKETIHFSEKHAKGGVAEFGQRHMSAGFLHSADILLTLFTPNDDEKKPLSPVILEEPESLLHPGAINALRDSFIEASKLRQVLVTSHSPELLDNESLTPDLIRSVYRDANGTHISTLDEATKSVVRDRLYTVGELLRSGALISGDVVGV